MYTLIVLAQTTNHLLCQKKLKLNLPLSLNSEHDFSLLNRG